MGWTFTSGASRKDIIEEVSQTWLSETIKSECIAKCTRGNVLWQVWQVSRKDESGDTFTPSVRWIGCVLMQNGGRDGWGAKEMSETMGPCYYTIPQGYLDMVPCPEGGEGWRIKVAAKQADANRVKKLVDGDVLKFDAALQFAGGKTYDTFELLDKGTRTFYAQKDGEPNFRCRLRSTTLQDGGYKVVR